MSGSGSTPTKPVAPRRGRKPKEPSASDNCRMCSCCFKTQFGNFTGKSGWISSENMFVAPTRKGTTLPKLADLLKTELFVVVEEGESFSARVCSPCGTKVRNCAAMLSQIREKLNTPTENEQLLRLKRMSKSPHSTQNKKLARPASSSEPSVPNQQPSSIAREVRARRSLALGSSLDFLEKENVFPFPPGLEDVADPPRNRSSETSVVVEVNYRNSTRTVAYDGSEQGNLVKYVTRKDWKAVINILFKMKEVKAVLPGAFQAIVSQEVKEYCNSMKVLKKTSPEELEKLSNVSIVEELENHCPLWSASARAVCGKLSKPRDSKITNAIALSSAILARCRNRKMSAVAHRISAVLVHSGAKSSDFTRLNRLGLCMSHDETIKKQLRLGEHHDAKVQSWKNKVESREEAKNLLCEIVEKQCKPHEDESVDFSQGALEAYSSFTEKAFKKCATLLSEKSVDAEKPTMGEIKDVLKKQSSENRKSYRLASFSSLYICTR